VLTRQGCEGARSPMPTPAARADVLPVVGGGRFAAADGEGWGWGVKAWQRRHRHRQMTRQFRAGRGLGFDLDISPVLCVCACVESVISCRKGSLYAKDEGVWWGRRPGGLS